MWTYAAIAVLEIGLPILTLSDETNVATVRVREIANFAKAMAHWLEQFSAAMVKHQESPCYQAALKHNTLGIPRADEGNKPGKLIRFTVHNAALLQRMPHYDAIDRTAA